MGLLVAGCVDASAPVFENPYDPLGSGDLPITVTLEPQGAGAAIAWTGTAAISPPPTGWMVEGRDCGASTSGAPAETSGTLAATARSWVAPGPVPHGGCREYRVFAVRDGPSRPSAAARLQRPPCANGGVNGCGGCGNLCADDVEACSGSSCAPCTSSGQCNSGQTCDTTVSPAACVKTCAADGDCGAGSYCSAAHVCKPCGLSDAAHCGTAATSAGCSVCSGAQPVCSAGACTCPNTVCGNACVNLSTDPDNCGTCGSPCTGPTHQCISGACIANYSWAAWHVPPDAPTNYTDNGDGTVKDNVTGLVWQKTVSASLYTLQQAQTYCGTLGLAGGGWRLPSRIELISIVDFTKYNPAINTTFLPFTPNSNYMFSPFASSPAFDVDFDYGFVQAGGAGSAFVRCVR